MTKTERSLLPGSLQGRGRQILHEEQITKEGRAAKGIELGDKLALSLGVGTAVREGLREGESEAVRRSRQSDPGFQTTSAKALRWPELVNGAGGGGGPGFPESQGERYGPYSERGGKLFVVALRA